MPLDERGGRSNSAISYPIIKDKCTKFGVIGKKLRIPSMVYLTIKRGAVPIGFTTNGCYAPGAFPLLTCNVYKRYKNVPFVVPYMFSIGPSKINRDGCNDHILDIRLISYT